MVSAVHGHGTLSADGESVLPDRSPQAAVGASGLIVPDELAVAGRADGENALPVVDVERPGGEAQGASGLSGPEGELAQSGQALAVDGESAPKVDLDRPGGEAQSASGLAGPGGESAEGANALAADGASAQSQAAVGDFALPLPPAEPAAAGRALAADDESVHPVGFSPGRLLACAADCTENASRWRHRVHGWTCSCVRGRG